MGKNACVGVADTCGNNDESPCWGHSHSSKNTTPCEERGTKFASMSVSVVMSVTAGVVYVYGFAC